MLTVHSLKSTVSTLVHPLFASINVNNPRTAHRICRLIPAQCPFERDVSLFGRQLFHIPAMCKLNPAYEDVMELRFKALVYLADVCGEDVSKYCR